MLGHALGAVEGIDEAWVFGSWADRYIGHPGPPPADIDVAVVGTASLNAVRAACRALEPRIGLEVNPVVLSRRQWQHTDEGIAASTQSAGGCVLSCSSDRSPHEVGRAPDYSAASNSRSRMAIGSFSQMPKRRWKRRSHFGATTSWPGRRGA